MNALIVGASAGVGRALSEELAARGHTLLLVASDARDLEVQAAHLRLVHGVHVEVATFDTSRPADYLKNIQLAANTVDTIDALFFPIGYSRPDDRGTLNMEESRKLLEANLGIVIGVISLLLPDLLAARNGYIVGFGSVASIRGRRANIVYSAAKRGLESYFESLRHLTGQTGIRVNFYRLGYVATQQTFGKSLLFRPIAPQTVAQAVVDNLDNDQGLVYFPRYWSIISRLISALPWFIFKRLDF